MSELSELESLLMFGIEASRLLCGLEVLTSFQTAVLRKFNFDAAFDGRVGNPAGLILSLRFQVSCHFKIFFFVGKRGREKCFCAP